MPEPDRSWGSAQRLTTSQKYARQSAIMGQGVTNALVQLADAGPGMRILDLASGTGEPALTLAPLVGEQGEVIGTDVNAQPLDIAAKRAAAHGIRNTTFEVADAHELPFHVASFDRVTCRFGVMYFRDVVQALREALRVLKPGGRIALAAWSRFEQPYFYAIAGTVLKHAGGPLLQPDEPSPFRFAEPGSLSSALRQAGFHDAEDRTTKVPWVWEGTPAEVWEYFRDVAAPFRPMIDRIPADKLDEVIDEVLREAARYQRGNRLEFEAEIVLATARA